MKIRITDELVKYLIRLTYLVLGIIFVIYLVLQISVQRKIRQVDEMLAKYDNPVVKAERISVEDQMWHYIRSLPTPKPDAVSEFTTEIEETIDVNLDGAIKVEFRTTAYCPCVICCGKTDGITASGLKATQWHTVAAGNDYPFGTRIYIPEFKDMPNGGWFVVEDRGGAVSNNRLDVFFNTHQEAINYGVMEVTAYVYYPTDEEN